MTAVIIDGTFTGKNISSPVSVYEHTVAATGTYRFQIRLAAVEGNGDYIAHLTLNDGDTQSDDVIAPRTTYTAASGETAFWFASMSIDAIAGDVINVFIKGKTNDTSEAGSIRIFADNYSTHAAADVWAVATSALTAAGTIGKLVADGVAAFNTMIALSAGAYRFTAAALGLSPTSTATVAITSTTARQIAAGNASITSYDTFEQAFTSTVTADLANAKIYYGVKTSLDDADASALVFVKDGDVSGNGLQYISGKAPVDPVEAGDASITVTGSSGAWVITVRIEARATGVLQALKGSYKHCLKYSLGSDDVTFIEGQCAINQATVRAL